METKCLSESRNVASGGRREQQWVDQIRTIDLIFDAFKKLASRKRVGGSFRFARQVLDVVPKRLEEMQVDFRGVCVSPKCLHYVTVEVGIVENGRMLQNIYLCCMLILASADTDHVLLPFTRWWSM